MQSDYLITPHFSYSELCCPCCGQCNMNPEFMQVLELTRSIYAKPMIPTSGYRCEMQNQKVGGSHRSQHLYGLAIDIKTAKDRDKYHLIKAAMQAGMTGIGIYKYHVHLDLRLKSSATAWAGSYPKTG